jgi:hypothetical protein
MTEPQTSQAGHPSPHRAKSGLAALLYGLIAAPAAWVVGEIVDAGLAQEACFPGTEPLATPAFANLHTIHIVVLVISLLVSASAAMVALGAWRATRNERAGGPHALLSIGEGRSRFMALAGVLTSVGFFVGTLFSVPAVLLVPSC